MIAFLVLSLPLLAQNPVELGKVKWKRNFDEAVQRATIESKPMLVLFQEVPG